jgi:methylenetetrahydrofolate dehydrogenase (NADP+) / methenyltetrahydrofolate cyclohydrolase
MILSGKAIAEEIQKEIKDKISLQSLSPGLAVILLGNHPSSLAYISMKRQACASVGIRSSFHHLPETTSENDLLKIITDLNHDSTIDGILVQLPLPRHINHEKIVESIAPQKDVDGFHPYNLGKLLLGFSGGFIPCTPLGIKILLERSNISLVGQHVAILGRSAIVGKPLAALLMQNAPGCNATVTMIHSQSNNIKELTLKADILVAAIGSPRFVKEDMVKEGAVVIDVGINREEDLQMPKGYRIVGDVDFNGVEKKCLAITPVPKGVGPMTVTMLLHNTLLSHQRKFG